MSQDVIDLFHPEELELMICGSKIIDFHDLEIATRYVDGYTSSSPIISWFWEVIHNDMNDKQRIHFLKFATGSDRVPVNGLSSLDFFISRHGPDTDRLPSAQTCFNHLLLPEYSSKEKLRNKMLIAIQYAEGFGMYWLTKLCSVKTLS